MIINIQALTPIMAGFVVTKGSNSIVVYAMVDNDSLRKQPLICQTLVKIQ